MNITIPTKCELCPRKCGAKRAEGARGFCGADGTLKVARAALHEWEEPPISARAGSGTVFFSNCPLRCVYCQNIDISQGGFGLEITTKRLAEIFLELQAQDAANINLVTATQYLPWVLPALEQAREQGLVLPVVWNTSGYETPETIAALAGFVDIYLTDFKYGKAPAALAGVPQQYSQLPEAVMEAAQHYSQAPEAAAIRYSQAPDYFDVASAALDAMCTQVGSPTFDDDDIMQRGVIVRHLLLPGQLEESKAVMEYLWESLGETVLYSVMNQYTPPQHFTDFPELNEKTTDEDYHALLDYMDALGMDDYFWQEGGAAQESFIPPFDTTGVEKAACT